MSSLLAPMTRSKPSTLCQAAVAVCLLFGGSASAQTANDPRALQNPRIRSAYSEWRRLSQKEVDCVDQSLRTRRSSLWLVIQRGINPSDAAMAAVRAACRAQARSPAPPPRVVHGGSQALAAVAETRTEQAADRTAEEKAAQRAAADKAAADKAAAERAAAEKTAADKTAADKAAADKAAADKAAAIKSAADTRGQVAADEAVAQSAKADAERANVDAIKTYAQAERPQQETARPIANAALAYASAEARISFVYGLVSGPIVFCLGGVVFLLLNRKRRGAVSARETAAFDGVSPKTGATSTA